MIVDYGYEYGDTTNKELPIMPDETNEETEPIDPDMNTVMRTWLTVKQVRDLTGLTETGVREAINGERLRGVLIGRTWRIDPDSVARFKKSNAGRPSQQS